MTKTEKQKDAEYYQRNKEKIIKRVSAYAKKNRAKIAKLSRNWQLKKIALGLCATCGKRPIVKFELCKQCCKKSVERHAIYRQKNREKAHKIGA